MSSIILSFLSSLLICLLILYSKKSHIKWTADEINKKHNMNSYAVPRVGGLAIYIGLVITIIYEYLKPNSNWYPSALLLSTILPIFTLGIIEDIFKNIKAIIRLAGSFSSAIIFMIIFKNEPSYIPFNLNYIQIVICIFFISLLINSYNIIDGLNGLSSMVGMMSILAITYVAYRVNDWMVIHLSAVYLASIMGFFVCNYPMGKIYLGDSGAYIIGFIQSSLSLLLLFRNNEISIWLIILINIYPIFEVIFSSLRRISENKNPMEADNYHLHSLLYKRFKETNENHVGNNHLNITPIMWGVAALGVIPGVLFWNNILLIRLFIILFTVVYLYFYKNLKA